MAARDSRKREMIAKLKDDAYVSTLVDEAYTIIMSTSTSNTVAKRKAIQAFEAGGCHIGPGPKHESWQEEHGDFSDCDKLLESDNSAGRVRDQIAIYSLTLMLETRLRFDPASTEREHDQWTEYREAVPSFALLDLYPPLSMLCAKVLSVHAARAPANPGAGGAAGRDLTVRVHVPKLEGMPSSATDENRSGQYAHLLQLKNAPAEDKTPDSLRTALSKDVHERLLTDFNLFERNLGDMSAAVWDAMSKAEKVDMWLSKVIEGMDVHELAAKELAKLKAFKQGSMTTELYFQELNSVITGTRLIYQIAYQEEPIEVGSEAEKCKVAMYIAN